MSYSPDGRHIALAADSHIVHVWDLMTGEEIGRLKGHQSSVYAVAFAPDGKTLATAGEDGTGLIWGVSELKSKKPLPAKLDEPAVRHYWNDLLATDGPRGFTAVAALAATPADTVPFLKRELKPAKPADPERIRQLIAKLESEKFAERKQAMRELTALGNLALDALGKTLASKPALELSKRAEELVARIRSRVLSEEELRLVRAIEVLEKIGGSAAREVLRKLASGAANALATTEARAALDRLK